MGNCVSKTFEKISSWKIKNKSDKVMVRKKNTYDIKQSVIINKVTTNQKFMFITGFFKCDNKPK